MTTDQIDKMIEQWNRNVVGVPSTASEHDDLRSLVRMAVEAEIEECAKVAEAEPRVWDHKAPPPQQRIAAAIRNRKEQP